MADQTYTYTNESFSGCDIVATMVVPNAKTGASKMYAIGEIQTISYSIHQDRRPVRSIGNINVKDYVMGPRTIAGSLVFAVFNKHFAYKIMKDLSDELHNGYAFLIDEIPPFNIVLSFANEYGLRSKMVIYGIRLVNEGQVMSINDIYTENTYQFVATDIEYLNNENEYSKVSSSPRNTYKITDTVRVESEIVYPESEEDNNIEGASVILRYEINHKEKIYKDNKVGRYVQFWLEPRKDFGTLKIYSVKSKNTEYNIFFSNYINELGRVVLPLMEDEYTAQWVSESEYSNIINLIISDDTVTNNKLQAPLIEKVTDTTISILSCVDKHTKCIHGKSTSDITTLTLPSSKRLTLKNLAPSTTYYIATINGANTEKSNFAIATTARAGYDEYLEFLEYLRKNKRALKINDFTVYEDVVYDTRSLAKTKKFHTMSEAFKEKLNRYYKEISLLNPADFPNSTDYYERVERLNKYTEAARHILRILSVYETDKNNGNNGNLNPIDLENNNNNTDIYTIEDGEYKKYESDYNFAEIFKENEDIYYVNIEDEEGNTSPTGVVYVPNDKSKSEWIEEQERIEKEIEYIKNKQKENIDYNLIECFNDEMMDRLATELALSNSAKFIAPLSVVEVTDTELKVKVLENKLNLTNNKIMIVISKIKTALDTTKTKYKAVIENQDIVAFNVKDYAIGKNNIYCIWLENKDGIQISNPITIKTYTNTIGYAEEAEYQSYFSKYFVKVFKDNFKDYETTLRFILDRSAENQANNKSSIYINILTEVMRDMNKVRKLPEVVYILAKTNMDVNYNVDNNFFVDSVKITSNELDYIKVSSSCYMHIISANKDKVIYENMAILENRNIPINKHDSNYIIIYFTNEGLNSVSGVIVINKIKKEFRTYKIKAEVKR